MIYQYGVKNGYGIIEWGARNFAEAIQWLGVKYSDPKLNAVEIVSRVNN